MKKVALLRPANVLFIVKSLLLIFRAIIQRSHSDEADWQFSLRLRDHNYYSIIGIYCLVKKESIP